MQWFPLEPTAGRLSYIIVGVCSRVYDLTVLVYVAVDVAYDHTVLVYVAVDVVYGDVQLICEESVVQ